MKRFFLFLLVLLLLPGFVSAVWSDDVSAGYEFNDGGQDVIGVNDLSPSGAASISSTVFKLGNGSFYEVANGKYENLSTSGIFSGGSNDFSSSFWINISSVSTPELFWDYDYTGGTGRGITVLWLANNNIRFAPYGKANDFTSFTYTANTQAHFVTVKSGTNWLLYVDGANVQNKTEATAIITNSTGRIRVGSDGSNYLRGSMDSLMFFDKALTAAQVLEIYNSGVGAEYPTSSPPVSDPYATVKVFDLYDNSTIEGLTVWIGIDSNVTDGSGVATVYNNSGVNFTVDGGTNYFNVSGTATENSTVNASVYGAFVSINVTNILNNTISNFTAQPDVSAWDNSTTNSLVYLYLKPNATNNVSIVAYDGNYTYNDSRQTYRNMTFDVNTSGKDASNYQLDGLYQSLLTVNISIGTTNSYIINNSVNVSGVENSLFYSKNTTNFTTEFKIMFANYTLYGNPQNYSLTTPKNYSIDPYNYTPWVSLPAYSLNSFYLTLLDEVTNTEITQNMTVELISELSAGVYTTTNGSFALEILTPTTYTLRYKSSLDNNYTERDYYQTLINQNYYELDLYSILNTKSTDMIVTIKDTGGDYVENATVKLLRYYTSCNCYKNVEMSKTSASGEAYFVVEAYNGHYKFSVEYQGINRFLSTSPENFIPSLGLVKRTITINLGAAYFESYRELTNIARTITYNNATKGLSFTWDDPSGIVTRGCLYASYLEGVHYTDVTPTCQNSSIGSVVLTLNNTANSFKYYAELETSTTYSEYTVFSGVIDKIRETLLSDVRVGAFLASGLILVLALMFSFSAIAVMIITAIGVVAMSVLGLAPLATTFITGFTVLVLGFTAYFMRS